MEHRQRGRFRESRQRRWCDSYVDRRACKHRLPDLCWKARRINERHPAALTQADEIDFAADLIHRHVKGAEIIVDPEKAHVAGRRAPVGNEKSSHSSPTQRSNKAVPGHEIDNGRTVQGLRSAYEYGRTFRLHSKITQSEGPQLERN